MLRKAAAIFERDVRLALSYRVNFWSQWVSIAISVAGFWFVSQFVPPSTKFGAGGRAESYFTFVVVGLAFVNYQSTAIQSFQRAIRGDQMLGTLEAILVTPTSLPLIVFASSLWPFALTTLQVTWYLVLAALLFGLDLHHANVAATLAFLALTVACMSPLGVLGAASVMVLKQTSPTNFIVGGAAQLLGGVLFPVSALPLPLQYVSWSLPLTHALGGIRGAVRGETLAQLFPDAAWLLIAALVLLPASLFAFRRAVDRAKMDGTLGHY